MCPTDMHARVHARMKTDIEIEAIRNPIKAFH